MSYFLFPPLKLTTIFGTAILSQETTNFSVSSYQKRNGSGVKKKKTRTNKSWCCFDLSVQFLGTN